MLFEISIVLVFKSLIIDFVIRNQVSPLQVLIEVGSLHMSPLLGPFGI